MPLTLRVGQAAPATPADVARALTPAQAEAVRLEQGGSETCSSLFTHYPTLYRAVGYDGRGRGELRCPTELGQAVRALLLAGA